MRDLAFPARLYILLAIAVSAIVVSITLAYYPIQITMNTVILIIVGTSMASRMIRIAV